MLPHHRSLPRSNLAVDERRIQDALAAEHARAVERALRPPWHARVGARVLSDRLDRALMDGADPTTSATLAARAAMLSSPATRAELADGLDVIIASAQAPPSRLRALPRHAALLANASLLRDLASVLRGPAPLYVRGIAMVQRLLTDGTGPMYTSRDGIALERALREARAAVSS
jgi:hypothetical protein